MKLILSSAQDVVNLLSKNPDLCNLGAFSGLRPAINEMAEANKSGCCKGLLRKKLSKSISAFQDAVYALSPDDLTKMKKLLNVSEVCYYVKNKENFLVLKCQ